MAFCVLNKKDSAYYYANSALETAKQHNLKKEIANSYYGLYNFNYKFGNYKEALENLIIYDSLHNEAYNLQVGQNSERAKIKYEQEKKDVLAQAKILMKENASKRLRNLQFTAIVVILLVTLFLIWNNNQKQKANAVLSKTLEKLNSTQSQLIQSEKMASLGELTAGIAHEIQNPLNFVNNFSVVNRELIEEMQDELKTGNHDEAIAISNNIKENEDKISNHGKRADAIVKGMLQHSRTINGAKELIDINALADEYLRLAYHGLRPKEKEFNATLKTDFDSTIGKIDMIPQDIGRILLNLYNNAFYAVDQKKKKSRQEEYEPCVSVSTKRTANNVEIILKDNGNGIPRIILDKIFQPFFTTSLLVRVLV